MKETIKAAFSLYLPFYTTMLFFWKKELYQKFRNKLNKIESDSSLNLNSVRFVFVISILLTNSLFLGFICLLPNLISLTILTFILVHAIFGLLVIANK
jgi:fatty acid desaturase